MDKLTIYNYENSTTVDELYLNNPYNVYEFVSRKWGRVINHDDMLSHELCYDTYYGTPLDIIELYQWLTLLLSCEEKDKEIVRIHEWITKQFYIRNINKHHIYYIGNAGHYINRVSEILLKNIDNTQMEKLNYPIYSKRELFNKVLHGEIHYNKMQQEYNKGLRGTNISQEQLEEEYIEYALKLFLERIHEDVNSEK